MPPGTICLLKEGTLDSGGWSQKLRAVSYIIPQMRHFIHARARNIYSL